jgi:hypothetical protein
MNLTSVSGAYILASAVLVVAHIRQNGVDAFLDRIFEEIVGAFNGFEKTVRIDHRGGGCCRGEAGDRIDGQNIARIGDTNVQSAVFKLERNELAFLATSFGTMRRASSKRRIR